MVIFPWVSAFGLRPGLCILVPSGTVKESACGGNDYGKVNCVNGYWDSDLLWDSDASEADVVASKATVDSAGEICSTGSRTAGGRR